MKEHQIEWNAATEQWFCINCLRASDYQSKQDAERELSQLDCVLSPKNGEQSKNRNGD